jgi:alpha-L-fucosidase 2
VNYYARLLDGDSAHKHLIGLLSNAADSSLLTYSRGGVAGAESNIFSLDGNTAGAAGIAEMLLQSQPDEIHLLPALPSAWHKGTVRGLCARGAIEVDLVWAAGRLVSARLKARLGGNLRLRYASQILHVTVPQDGEITVYPSSFRRA